MANINENGYILSDKIKVYPCAYRGSNINEEARLSTEFNISHTAGLKLGNYGKDSYVIAYANNVLKFVIHGYYFEATLASDDTKPKYAYIKIKSVNFNTGSTNTSEAAKTTEILANIKSSTADVLDGTPDGTTAGPSYFYGINFTQEVPSANETNIYPLALFNTDGDITESSYFTISYRGIESSKSGTAITGNLISGTGTSSLQQTSASNASSSGSVAFGNGTIANKDYQFVIGKYNEQADGLFVVGNGTGESNRSNAIIIDSNKITINTAVGIIGNSVIIGNTTLMGETALYGETTLTGDVTLTGDFTISNVLQATDTNITVDQNLDINSEKQISFGTNNTTINKNTLLTTYVGNSDTPITHITTQTISADSLTVNDAVSSVIGNLNSTILNIQSADDIDGKLTITEGASFEIATGATATFNVKPTITGTKLYSDITGGQGVLVQTFTSGQANDPSWLSTTTENSILYYDNTGINWKATNGITVNRATTATTADKVILPELTTTDTPYKLLAQNTDSNADHNIGYTGVTIKKITTGWELAGLYNITGSSSGSISGFNTIQATTFNATSDKRLKENIVDYKAEKSILDLPVYKYDFIDGPKNQIGCLAQDLQEICPEIVSENEDEYLSIQESKLVYLLLDEVKKLKKEVEELKK